MRDRYRVGIDVGGTFTDFTLMDEESGATDIFKLASTPDAPERAVITGFSGFASERGLEPGAISYFVHGTTIAVNTVLERSGALTGLLVTEGFRDLMTLGRSRLSDTYNFLVEKPEPLVPRHLVREIRGRTLASGAIHTPLDEDQVREQAIALREQGIETLAICFLHAFRNPALEDRAREIASAACPGLYVCTSAEVWPQMREFERALVTVINAHVGPRMDSYFDRLLSGVESAGVTANVMVTKSNGGVMTARSARAVPVQTLVSGPASGVSGARYVGELAGHRQLIALDMGGTSTEVAVIDQEILYSTENTIGHFPVVIPAVDVSSIGAGGGSIAWTDISGVLKVGPRSAGAAPGPACYGLGGREATITDAYVVLGIVDPERFLGGRMRLDPDLARAALAPIAERLGLPDERQAAEAVLRVATSNMYSALVPLMAQKGVDISDFSLLTYGGAGPTHGFLLAREVGIDQVIVPPHPGTLCALGCLVSDAKGDFIRTVNLDVDPDRPEEVAAEVRRTFAGLAEQAGQWLTAERIDVQRSAIAYSADMRFGGQAFEVEVPLPDMSTSADGLGAVLLDAFYARYRALYNVPDLRGTVEIVNARATVTGVTRKPVMRLDAGRRDTTAPPLAERTRATRLYLDGADRATVVFDRDALVPGDRFSGPAVIHQYDSTTFVPPDFDVTVDAHENLIGTASR